VPQCPKGSGLFKTLVVATDFPLPFICDLS
jgi:hypothetical protein